MMVKRMALIRRKAGTTREEFRRYYETHHAVLARRLFPMFAYYKRNYIHADAPRLPAGATEAPYDVVTEMGFATAADYQAFLEIVSRPEVHAEVRADEARFLDPSSIFSFTVTETVLPEEH